LKSSVWRWECYGSFHRLLMYQPYLSKILFLICPIPFCFAACIFAHSFLYYLIFIFRLPSKFQVTYCRLFCQIALTVLEEELLCSLNHWDVFLICWIRKTDCGRRLYIAIRPNHVMQPECAEDGAGGQLCGVKSYISSACLRALCLLLPLCLLGTRSEIQLVQCVNLPFGAEAGI